MSYINLPNPTFIGARANLATDQTVAASTVTLVLFATTTPTGCYDIGNYYDETNSRFVAQTPGYYRAKVQIYSSAYNTDERILGRIRLDGATNVASFLESDVGTEHVRSASCTIYLGVNQYLDVTVDSVADTSYTISSSNDLTFFCIEKVG